jgi:hypothetical protein
MRKVIVLGSIENVEALISVAAQEFSISSVPFEEVKADALFLFGVATRDNLKSVEESAPEAIKLWVGTQESMDVNGASCPLTPIDSDLILYCDAQKDDFNERAVKLLSIIGFHRAHQRRQESIASENPEPWTKPQDEWPVGSPVFVSANYGRELIEGKLEKNNSFRFCVHGESYWHSKNPMIHADDPAFHRFKEAHELDKVKDLVAHFSMKEIVEKESVRSILTYAKSLIEDEDIQSWHRSLLSMGAATNFERECDRHIDLCKTQV